MPMNRNFGTPGNPALEKRVFPDVDLFFIGTLQMNAVRRADGSFGKLPLPADGFGGVTAPPVGEKIRVAQNKAEALIRNGRIEYPKGHAKYGQTEEAWTTDPRIAELVAKSWNEGVPLAKVKAEAALETLSIEELEAALARKRAVPEEEKKTEPVRTVGRPKKEAE